MKFAQKYVIVLSFVLLCSDSRVWAQRPSEVVKWSTSVAKVTPAIAQVVLSATLAEGWHVYALSQPVGGPTPLKITTPAGSPYEIQGS